MAYCPSWGWTDWVSVWSNCTMGLFFGGRAGPKQSHDAFRHCRDPVSRLTSNSLYKLWWGGVERSWGEGEILKMWTNLNKSALRFSIDRKHFWTANFSKTKTITWLLSIYKRQTEDITSIFGINWRIKMPFCNLSLRLPSLSSKERKVPPVLQTH